MATKIKFRNAASVAEERILELTAQFDTVNYDSISTMTNGQTVKIPHLGGTIASYRWAAKFDSSKPTILLINSFATSSELYRSQFANEELTDAVNLISIEPLGHGQTRTRAQHYTYWDSAVMNLQALQALGMRGRVFVLGTSQGGWIATRMALIAPERIAGIILLGTSMDSESDRSRNNGCWNAHELLNPMIKSWTTNAPTPDWEVPEALCSAEVETGFGKDAPDEKRKFWSAQLRSNYQGDLGRRRLRMATINLRDRDSLHGRLDDIHCPVLWLQGTADAVYSVANAEEEIKLFENSRDAQLKTVEGGQHFLSESHPKEVDEAVISFVKQYGNMALLTRVDR